MAGEVVQVEAPRQAVQRCVLLSRPIFDAIPGDFLVAGGWVRDQFEDPPRAPKDADLWFYSLDAQQAALAELAAAGHRAREDVGSGGQNAKVSHPSLGEMDLIRDDGRDGLATVLLGFDLTCCMGAVDREGRVWAHRDFVEHVENKRLVVGKAKSGVGELRRAIRLAARGYEFWNDDARAAIVEWHEAIMSKPAKMSEV